VTIERWFRTENMQMPFVSTCDNLSVIRQLVKEGAGIAVLPVPIVTKDLADGSIVMLDVRPPVENHRVYAAYHEVVTGYGTNTIIRAAEAVIRRNSFLTPGIA
jgi:DNA-binding transcriptional LysR family regulator